MPFGERLEYYASDEARLQLRICSALRPTIQPEQQKLKHASDSPPKPNNYFPI